jgi:hypothetical protein
MTDMKKVTTVLLLATITLLTFNCQKEINYNVPGGQDNSSQAPITGTLQGNVLDENGDPAAGVSIKVGTKTAMTNSKGYFRIAAAVLDRNASHVTAEKPGYFTSHRSFRATEGVNQVTIRLIPKTLAGTVSAGSGGEVTLTNGSKISLPSNAVRLGTTTYTGTINVYAAYIDPSSDEIAETVPGSFMANDKDDRRVTLASFGMLAVELESPSGEKLQVAEGKKATLTTAIPAASLAAAPATISLWYLNEQTGLWEEEGTATRSGNVYVGDVSHFSFWNCDIGIPAITLSMTVKNGHGDPIVHALVRISRTGATNWIQAYGITDSLGKVSGLVPANESLLVEVLDPCMNPVYSQNAGPYSQNTNLGVITINNTGTSLVNVTGRILNCAGNAVTEGYAIVYFNNMVRYANTNANGEFAVSFITCPASATQVEVTPVDESVQQQGVTATVPIVSPVTNAGNLTACGISAEQYINYTLDGTNYSTNSLGNDSLMGYTWQQGTVPFTTILTGMSISSNSSITVEFQSNSQVAGTYPVSRLYVNGFNQVEIITPFNITLTNFPATAGGFYEGSFTGQFRDQSNPSVTHNLNGTFRLRR